MTCTIAGRGRGARSSMKRKTPPALRNWALAQDRASVSCAGKATAALGGTAPLQRRVTAAPGDGVEVKSEGPADAETDAEAGCDGNRFDHSGRGTSDLTGDSAAVISRRDSCPESEAGHKHPDPADQVRFRGRLRFQASRLQA